MLLPYSLEVWFAAMAEYRAAWAPVDIVGVVAALAIAVLPATRFGSRRTGFVAATVTLGALWLWVGAVFQIGHMAAFDFMAPWYGIAWIAQGGILVAFAALATETRLSYRRDAAGAAGLVLSAAGLALAPATAFLSDLTWDALPLAGSAPDPTALLTVGVLLAMRPFPPLYLLIVPLAWASVAAVQGWLLAYPADIAVAAVLAAGVALAAVARFRRRE